MNIMPLKPSPEEINAFHHHHHRIRECLEDEKCLKHLGIFLAERPPKLKVFKLYCEICEIESKTSTAVWNDQKMANSIDRIPSISLVTPEATEHDKCEEIKVQCYRELQPVYNEFTIYLRNY